MTDFFLRRSRSPTPQPPYALQAPTHLSVFHPFNVSRKHDLCRFFSTFNPPLKKHGPENPFSGPGFHIRASLKFQIL